eukprot:scaffold180803_cov30-Tisochrysis_lutea.AAC.1
MGSLPIRAPGGGTTVTRLFPLRPIYLVARWIELVLSPRLTLNVDFLTCPCVDGDGILAVAVK